MGARRLGDLPGDRVAGGVLGAPELAFVQALVAETTVERLAEAVLRGLPGAMWKVSAMLSSSQSTNSRLDETYRRCLTS